MMPSPSLHNPLPDALRSLHPVGKVICCGVLLVCVVALPTSTLPKLGGLGAMLLGLWVASGSAPLLLVKRLAVALPFILMAALSLPFMSQAGKPVLALPANLMVTQGGLELLLGVVVKALLCLTALSLLSAVTSTQDLLTALHSLRFPRLFLTVLSLTARYLLVLGDEAARMTQARAARGRGKSLRRRAGATGALVGSLFLRSYERAERVGRAMAARGFAGTLPAMAPGRPTVRDALASGAFIAATLAVVLW